MIVINSFRFGVHQRPAISSLHIQAVFKPKTLSAFML